MNLYFVEANPQAEKIGGRVFNVSTQGTTVFANLDIFAAAGADTALIERSPVEVTNGKLTIGFAGVSGLNPKISAIEILPDTSSGPLLTLKFQYPDGTPVSGTLAYTISSSLLTFQGSEPLLNGQAQAVLLANPSSLGISAQFQVNLSLKDTGGHVLWQLTLGMNPSQVNLGAVQSSALNVIVQRM